MPHIAPPEILSLGEPLVEFSAEAEAPLAEAVRFVRGFGGDTSNFAVAVSRLGGRAGYIARIGADEFGDSLLGLYEREGVDARGILRDPEAPTGLYFISRSGGEHGFTYYRRHSAASRMTPAMLPAEAIRQARWLHVSGISQLISASACDTVFAAMQLARAAGIRLSFDPNYRPKLCPLERARGLLHRAAALADVVMPSLEDGRLLTGIEAPEAIARFYLDLGPATVVLKLGAAGALLAERSAAARSETRMETGSNAVRIRHFEPHAVKAVDATGAGDTFDGALAVGWTEGRPIEDCVRFANAAAALTTTGIGAVAPIPHRAAVDRLLDCAAGGGRTANPAGGHRP